MLKMKRAKNLLLLSVLIGAVVIQSASANDKDLSGRVEVLERTISGMQKSLMNAISDSKWSNANKSNINQSLDELTDEIKMIRTDVNALEAKFKSYSERVKLFEQSVNEKMTRIESSKSDSVPDSKNNYIVTNIVKEIESNSLTTDTPAASAADDSQVALEYQRAYTLLKQKTPEGKPEYDKAVDAFRRFINHFPETSLKGNAYYWIAYIYFQEKQYSKSAVEFLNGYKANPKSGRAIDNLLGLSSTLFYLGKTKETCSTLNKLYNEFPNMNLTNKREADELYKNAGCTSEQ